MRLAKVIKRIEAIPMGGTDCALPMLRAARNKLNVSGFVTYTDSETWAGRHPPGTGTTPVSQRVRR
jgi:60 kDa SS-A/Ro ribonucleoprotein